MSHGHLQDSVDLSVLVDIVSNIAGMMILLACISLKMKTETPVDTATNQSVKSLSFPLAYLPHKRSVTICLKNGQLYELPDEKMLQNVVAAVADGTPITELTVEDGGVEGTIGVTPTATGYRFEYNLKETGGLPLGDTVAVTNRLDQLIKRFPPSNYFYVFNTWPDEFESFREIREYLHDHEVEVGWMPRDPQFSGPYDIAYSIGEYSEGLSSIKAQ